MNEAETLAGEFGKLFNNDVTIRCRRAQMHPRWESLS